MAARTAEKEVEEAQTTPAEQEEAQEAVLVGEAMVQLVQ